MNPTVSRIWDDSEYTMYTTNQKFLEAHCTLNNNVVPRFDYSRFGKYIYGMKMPTWKARMYPDAVILETPNIRFLLRAFVSDALYESKFWKI